MKINKIFIVGAGLMGCGIAQVAVQSGYSVILNDVNESILLKAKHSIIKQWERYVAKEKMTQTQLQCCLTQLQFTNDINLAKECDLIIEAVYENFDVKSKVLSSINSVCKKDSIIASNTSSISITTLASFIDNKERFVGMHFFSPVPVMTLIEIIPALCTSVETVRIVKNVGVSMNKNVIIAKDMPGFIVNRMLDLMLNEAVQIIDEGTGCVEDVDSGMKFGCNYPMGPLELIDMAGVDILLAVMEVFYKRFGDSKYRPCILLQKMVNSGYLGKKTGAGFYVYDDKGKKAGVNPIFLNNMYIYKNNI